MTVCNLYKAEDEEVLFFEGMESKKWKVRAACLDLLNKQLGMDTNALPDDYETVPEVKLTDGDYKGCSCN